MQEQRERARAARGGETEDESAQVLASLADDVATEFEGYEHLQTTARVLGISDGTRSLPVGVER